MKLKTKNPIEQILDENNNEDVVLYDPEGKPIIFEQIAVIPLDENDKLYAILLPTTPMQGVNEGEAVVFEINETTQDISIVRDEDVIDKICKIYEECKKEEDDDESGENK